MKLWQLTAALQELAPFESPDVSLEQYSTGAELAADALFSINSSFGDIEGRLIADVGCGTGILGIGCALLGAGCVVVSRRSRLSFLEDAITCRAVVGFDVDSGALEQARANADIAGLEQGEFEIMLCDVLAPTGLPVARTAVGAGSGDTVSACGPFDVAIMNPCVTDARIGVARSLEGTDSRDPCRPFGTRRPGADVGFVVAGLNVVHSTGVVYR